MSLRRLNRIAFQVVLEMIQRFKNTNTLNNFGKVGLKILKHNRLNLRRTVLRGFRVVARQPAQLCRPFASLHFRHQNQLNQRLNGFNLIKDNKPKRDVLHLVRHLFGTNARYNRGLSSTEMPNNLDAYEIGKYIASGCNGAVFQLRLKQELVNNNIDESRFDHPYKLYPLALKVLFIDGLTQERFIWNEMGSELIPLVRLPKTVCDGKFARIKTISRSHPNIIKVYTAFTDKFSSLPEAEKILINKLQNRRFNLQNCLEDFNEAKTLYVVMKRYRMTLQTYLKSHKRNYLQARIMFGQLLEAIVFLHKNIICHRDMKSDNILLDFDFEDEVPHLVLSDFGSALSNGEWTLHSSSDGEFSDLGGNLALRAPEIRRIRPGLNSWVNYEMADTWAAGTLAFEIFTRRNPFYAVLSSATYKESDLPPLPTRLINPIKQVIHQMLCIDPKKRPKPEIGANIVAISLFGMKIGKVLDEFSNKIESAINSIVQLYASETILARFLNPKTISNAELQLRATFLSRMNFEELHTALNYYIENREGGIQGEEIPSKLISNEVYSSFINQEAFSSAITK
uniref:non-specific serine/threonine protein kinase n=2 Tax=Meloidogyne TaxID=189290 RepID=A0A914LT09_MELIC